jgi:hypothetical protein
MTKSCRDCNFCRESALSPRGTYDLCFHVNAKNARNLMTGKMQGVYCSIERTCGNCGPEGKFFVPRVANPIKSQRVLNTIKKWLQWKT